MSLISRIAAAWNRFWLGRSLKEEFDAILAEHEHRAPVTDYAVHTRGDADYDDSMMPPTPPLVGLDIVTGEVAAITPAAISEAVLDKTVTKTPPRRANAKKRIRKRGKPR